MKRFVAVVLSGILLCCSMTGCMNTAKEQNKEKNIKIGISLYNQHDTFITEMMTSVEKYAAELEETYGITVTLDVQSAGGNQMVQNDQMEYFIDREFDIVCINLVDRTDASTIIERGKSANLPIIFFNRELVEEDLTRWDQLYYVGADAFESGIIQGELLVEKLQDNFSAVDKNNDGVIQYVMLEGEAGHQDSIVRTMYAVNTVTDAGYEVEKLADEIANWNRDQGKTKMVQWIQEFDEEIEVVFANNDDMALGAIDALKEAGYFTKNEKTAPIVLGIDGTQDGKTAVNDGHMLGTVLNDYDGQAKAMIELAYAVVFDKELSNEFVLLDEKYIRLPYQRYTKEAE